jgi:hypothetical protein
MGRLSMATYEDSTEWQIVCNLPMVLPAKSPTIRLSFHKVWARWIPKQLTMLHKQIRLDTCQQYFDRYGNERDAFITGDKTLIHHCEPGSEGQSMEWKHPHSPNKEKFNSQPSVGKLMLTVFWTSHVQYWNISGEGRNNIQSLLQ